MSDQKNIRERLEFYQYIDNEIAILNRKIKSAKGEIGIMGNIQSSDPEFPYTLGNKTIYGFENLCDKDIQDKINGYRIEISNWIAEKQQLEQYVENIPDLKIRQIAYRRYIYGDRWKDIAARSGGLLTEDSAKKKIQRFFKMCPECPQCPDFNYYN